MARTDARPNVLLGLTGSVASIKAVEVARHLAAGANIKVVATQSARAFFCSAELQELAGPVLGDEEEWRLWRKVGDDVLHIELRRWADVFVIAPLSANTLAKMANGMADNLLTCVVRAWDFKQPLLVAPAMNTYMWESPFTEQHLGVLTRLGATVVPPVSKKLACGDVGQGAMATPESIARACWAALAEGRGGQLPHAPSEFVAAAGTEAPAAPAADAAAAADVAAAAVASSAVATADDGVC